MRPVIVERLKASEERARAILRRAKMAMAVDCATLARKGECPHINEHCLECTRHTALLEGLDGGWCKRQAWAARCWVSDNPYIARAGWCSPWGNMNSVDDFQAACPVWLAWSPVVRRAYELAHNTRARLLNGRQAYIERAAGAEPEIDPNLMFDEYKEVRALSGAGRERWSADVRGGEEIT